MPLSEKDIELIEKYIHKALSGEEKELFDVKMQEEAFREELAAVRTGQRSLNIVYRKRLKEELIGELKDYRKKQALSPHFSKRYLYWAASVSIIVFFCALYFFRSGDTRAGAVFAENYRPYQIAIVGRNGQTEEYDHPAFTKYQSRDYQEAGRLLEQLISEENQFDRQLLQLLLGNCYLNSGNPDKALATFKQVMDSDQLIYEQHGRWYYALTLLKEHKTEQSLKLFQYIASADPLYAEQAEKIIKELK